MVVFSELLKNVKILAKIYPGAVSSQLTIDKAVYQQLIWLRGWLDDKKSLAGDRTPKNCQIHTLLSAEFSITNPSL